MLRQHVQATLRDARRLDTPLHRQPRDQPAVKCVGGGLGKYAHHTHLARPVPRAAQALQFAGNRARTPHLQHQIHKPHVNAQLH